MRPTQFSRPIGQLRHRVSLDAYGQGPDGDGGYEEGWTPLDPPTVWAAIEPATTQNLEGVTGGVAVRAVATHVVTMDFHPALTISSRVVFRGREFQIHAIQNVDERDVQLVCACSEVVHG